MARNAACNGTLGWLYLASMLLGCGAVLGDEGSPGMIIVQPGYPGSTEMAGPFMLNLTGYLEGKAGLKGLKGVYHNKEADALQAIAEKKPGFGLVSLPFYLEHRKRFGLKAFLRVTPGDNFVILVGKGDVKDVSALAGEVVAGGPLYESAFLERIALRGKADVASWKKKPTTLGSRAARNLVRALDRKRKPTSRAVVLTGREYRTLTASGLSFVKSLEKILESDYYPPAILVTFQAWPAPAASGETEKKPEEKTKSETAEKKEDKEEEGTREETGASSRALPDGVVESVVRAFSGLPGDAKGKGILSQMGAEGFEKFPADWLKDLERSYDVTSEEK